MTWRDRPMCGMDTETTGTDVETARIVTACVGLATPNGWMARNWLFRQDKPIPAEATAVHGITTEHANEHGTNPAEGVAAIRDDLYKAWALGMPVVVFNAPFDLTLLDRELARHGMGGLEVRGPVLDPLVIDKAIDRFRKGSRKLIDTCAHYGITLSADDAHGAEADTLAACRLAWKLGGAMPRDLILTLGDIALDDLHQWQADQYAEQRRSFAEYLARQGKTLDDDSTEWPLRTQQATTTNTAA